VIEVRFVRIHDDLEETSLILQRVADPPAESLSRLFGLEMVYLRLKVWMTAAGSRRSSSRLTNLLNAASLSGVKAAIGDMLSSP
jgi:hypothetical protein